MRMKELAKTLQIGGFQLKQLKREGSKALYRKTKKDMNFVSYEVIKIGSHNGYELGGQHIEAAETYPSNSQWGRAGWTHNDLERAEAHYKKLKK